MFKQGSKSRNQLVKIAERANCEKHAQLFYTLLVREPFKIMRISSERTKVIRVSTKVSKAKREETTEIPGDLRKIKEQRSKCVERQATLLTGRYLLRHIAQNHRFRPNFLELVSLMSSAESTQE